LIGENRNVHSFSAHLDALSPTTVRAGDVSLSDSSILSSEASESTLDPLGSDSLHSVLAPQSVRLLDDTREEQNDLDDATASSANSSAFAYTANTEVDAIDYNTVLSPYQVISVSGPGCYLSGNYLISHVQHTINYSGYKQSLTLRRNARSCGSSCEGGPPGGGVF